MTVRHAPRYGAGVGRPGLSGDAPTPSLPVCPFASRGLDDAAVGSCPGYAPETVSFHGIGAGESIGHRECCAHLDVQRGGRGFVTACSHPGGMPAGAVDVAHGLARRGAVRPH